MGRTFLKAGEVLKYVGPSSTVTEVFGTTGVEMVYVTPDGNGAFDPSFNRGGDRIFFQDSATNANSFDYQGKRVGSNLVLTSQIYVGASISIPAGGVGTQLTFKNGTFVLIADATSIKLGDQVITTTAERLDDVGPGVTPAPAAALSLEIEAADQGVAAAADDTPAALPAVLAPGEIFGTSGHETVQLGADAKVVFDPSFNRGGDEIIVAGSAESYAAARSGSNLVLTNDAGASITIPVGGAGATVTFDNGSYLLVVSDGAIKLGDHVVTTAAAILDDLGQTLDQLLAAALVPAGDDAVPALPELPLDSAPLDQPAASSQTLLG